MFRSKAETELRKIRKLYRDFPELWAIQNKWDTYVDSTPHFKVRTVDWLRGQVLGDGPTPKERVKVYAFTIKDSGDHITEKLHQLGTLSDYENGKAVFKAMSELEEEHGEVVRIYLVDSPRRMLWDGTWIFRPPSGYKTFASLLKRWSA